MYQNSCDVLSSELIGHVLAHAFTGELDRDCLADTAAIPFGLQVTAPRFRDGWLLELAEGWGEKRPWPRVARGYDPFEVALGLT